MNIHMNNRRYQCLALSILVMSAACVDEERADDAAPDEEMELIESGLSSDASGDVDAGSVDMQEASYMVGASLERVLSDGDAQMLLGADDTLIERLSPACYTKDEIDTWTLEFDFEDCDDTNGHVLVNRIESGLVVVTFESDFTINDISVVGSLAFERVTTERVTYAMYNSDGEGVRGPAIVVTNPGEEGAKNVFVEGTTTLAALDAEFVLWADGMGQDATSTHEFVLGGDNLTQMNGTEPPLTALTWDLPRRNCECPTDGRMFFQATKILIDGVTVDLDNFERVSNQSDDFPEFSIPLDLSVIGNATIDVVGCGEFAVDFDAGIDVSVDIPRGEILTAAATACSNGTLDGVVCDGLDGRIRNRVASRVNVTIPDLQQDEAARRSLGDRFDRSICY